MSTIWFRRDDPVADLAADDSFGHKAYSELLADALLQTDPPFTFGIFGDWGVGKTTITKDYLRETLRVKSGDSVGYAYFDVWKYEGDSLRRQFLRDVAEQLKNAHKLKRGYDPERELDDLTADVKEVAEEGLRLSWKRFLLALIRGALGGAVFFVALRVLERLDTLKPGNSVSLSLVVGLVIALATELGSVVVVGQREIIRKSIDSPDIFEDKFVELMNNVKASRVVFVIDNLDRCTPDRVIEVLTTIKAFLEPTKAEVQPLFVIPCDDEAIRRHLLKRGEIEPSDSDEYLRKFFNATLRLNPILDEEIRAYAEEQLDGLELGAPLSDEQRRELLQIVSVAFRENPRRVKQFFNTVTSKLLLIRLRESAGVITPPISSEIPFLAKLTVIEEEWSEFFNSIRDDPRHFDLLTQRAIGIPGETPASLEDFSADKTLMAFLRGTRRTGSRHVRAFTRLKLAPIEQQLSNYAEYRSALVDGRLEELDAMLVDLPLERLQLYQTAAIATLREESNAGYFEAALNAADALIRLEHLHTEEVANDVAEVVYSVEGLRALLPSLAPYETLKFLSDVTSDAGQQLVDEYISLIGREDLAPLVPDDQREQWQFDVVRGLTGQSRPLSAAQRQALRPLVDSTLSSNIGAIAQLAGSDGGPEAFITPAAIKTAVDRLGSVKLSLSDGGQLVDTPTVVIWKRSLEIATAEHVSALVTQQAARLEASDATELTRSAALQVLLASVAAFERVDETAADLLAASLTRSYAVLQTSERWQAVAIVGAVWEQLTETGRQQAISLLRLLTTESSGDISPLIPFNASGTRVLPDELLTELVAGLTTSLSNAGTLDEQLGFGGILIENAPDLGWDTVEASLNAVVDAGRFATISALIDHFREQIVTGAPELVARLKNRVISVLPTAGAALQQEGLAAIAGMGTLDAEQRKALRDFLLGEILGDDPAQRASGLVVLSQAEDLGLQRDDERKHIAEQLIRWIYGNVEMLDENARPVLDRVAKDIGLLDESARDNLASALVALLARTPSARAMASEYLGQIAVPDSKRDQTVEELIHWSRQETDTTLRHSLIRAAFQQAKLGGHESVAMSTVSAYLRELTPGESDDSQLAAQLLETDSPPQS